MRINRFRPRPLPALFTAAVIVLCLALGFWQIERRHWKEALIAQRETAFAAPPIALPSLPLPPSPQEAAALAYRRVVATGVFRHDKEILLHAIGLQGGAGFEVWTPLRQPDGSDIFVDRGFVAAARAHPELRGGAQPDGAVRVTGILRLPPPAKPGWFLPENRPAAGEWFWPDLPAMAAAVRLDAVAFYYIAADPSPNPGGGPSGAAALPALPNDHLQYAITWFSLAGAALLVYLLSQRGAAAQRDGPTSSERG